MAISDLQHMLKGMAPVLAPVPYGIVTVAALARFVNALADKAISANVIASAYQNHILVKWWDQRDVALAALRNLSHA